MDIKPAFPIGKTQWSKWGDEAREAYNIIIAKGFGFATAVEEANAVQASLKEKKRSIGDLLGDVVDAVAGVSGVVAAVDSTVQTVKRVTRKKKAN